LTGIGARTSSIRRKSSASACADRSQDLAADLRRLPQASALLLGEAASLEEAATTVDRDAYLASGAPRLNLPPFATTPASSLPRCSERGTQSLNDGGVTVEVEVGEE
jgi:hypothetical protein